MLKAHYCIDDLVMHSGIMASVCAHLPHESNVPFIIIVFELDLRSMVTRYMNRSMHIKRTFAAQQMSMDEIWRLSGTGRSHSAFAIDVIC